MDKHHTAWNWIVCSILTSLVVVGAECPENAVQKAQLCTANLGIGPGPPSSDMGQFVESGNMEKARMACRDGLFQKVVTCLREVTSVCTGNMEREHIVRMMVDPDKTEESINYFCKNINIYESHAKCIADSHPEQNACISEVRHNFKTKAMATSNIDVMMTSTCRYFQAGLACISKFIKKRCGQQALDITMTTLRGFQPPKCKTLKFDEGTYTVSDAESSANRVRQYSLLLLICALLCHYVFS